MNRIKTSETVLLSVISVLLVLTVIHVTMVICDTQTNLNIILTK